MTFYLVNASGKALSQIEDGDLTERGSARQLKFRNRDWYSYPSAEEAENHKESIVRRAHEKSKKAARRLVVATTCQQNTV